MKSIIIPSSVTYIGSRCFSNCSGLKEINIPETVLDKYIYSRTIINYGAFWNCSSLKNITIPIKFKNSMKDIFTYIDLSKVNINYT